MSNNIEPTLNLITPVVDVYYYIPEYSHISSSTENIEEVISVGNFNVGLTIIDPTHCIVYSAFTTMYCKYYQHKWVMHRDDGPAYMSSGERCGFYYNGTNFKVENLPIDNETKLMLALKYTPIMLGSRYNWYDCQS